MSQQGSAVRDGKYRVLVVEPFSSGTRVLTDCRDLDIEVCVASADEGERVLSPELRELVAQSLVLDTNDEPALAAAVADLHAVHPLAAVIPGVEATVPSANRIARRLGLPALPLDSLDAVRDKALMRERAAAAGLRVPRFARAASVRELEEAAAVVGFPCVIKPLDLTGSIHVTRVEDVAELLAAHRLIVEDTRLDLGVPTHPRVIVEEYVAGPEFSADGYIHAGDAVVVSLTRKLLGAEPYFVELGHIAHADEGAHTARLVNRYVQTLVDALHLDFGPFHCELRLCDGEPVLIEIAARLPGDRIVELVERATGVSLSRAMLAGYLGRAPQDLETFGTAEAACVGIRYFAAEGHARYTEIKGWDALRARPEVLEAGVFIGPGEDIPALHDFRGRIAYALFTADTDARARALWHELDAAIEVI